MAGAPYIKFFEHFLTSTAHLGTGTYKAMLVKSTYVFDAKMGVIDTGNDDTEDASFQEADATGYTRGFGGAGRKTVTFTTRTRPTADLFEIAISDAVWTSIGGATNNTLGGMIIFKPGSVDDTDAVPLLWIPFSAAVTTNGGNVDPLERALTSGGVVYFSSAPTLNTAWVNNT